MSLKPDKSWKLRSLIGGGVVGRRSPETTAHCFKDSFNIQTETSGTTGKALSVQVKGQVFSRQRSV